MAEHTKYQIFKLFVDDTNHPFSGWDFSYIRDRMVTEPFTWSYSSEILPYVRTVDSMLDMGTGGGEFLLSILPLPRNTHATESYEPNIPVARRNLEPIGVKVIEFTDENSLPIEDEKFDLIINRHESYSVKEVKRILKKNGYFITQQVGAKNDLELNQLIKAKLDLDYAHWNMDYAVKELTDAGFTIIKKMECFPKTRCFDIGAIIFYLKVIPWQIPDFSIEKYQTKLKDIHLLIHEKGYIDITSHYFLIVAKK
ncbi:MAG TPA: class I SAM-dependent methyltransferase [Candidatus Bathyarchaeia archaeon]|nr:class I SAM-dependent methyltransferase [Candidatus Bathyarchaeia archaeon]